MTVWDTFMFNRELDMLECRLTELQDVPNVKHVIVEAEVDHQDHPKPLHFADNRERFAAWADRIVHVVARNLPTKKDFPDPWAREHAQREHTAHGLCDAQTGDVIIHGDLDEIPYALVVRNLRPRGLIALEQRMACFAVDWVHPDPWRGPVVGVYGAIPSSFGAMRDCRNIAPALPNAGWHLSWLGTTEDNLAKLGSFCHPEIAERTLVGLQQDAFGKHGYHVDGVKMEPVEVDETWPRWVHERKCPESWWRAR